MSMSWALHPRQDDLILDVINHSVSKQQIPSNTHILTNKNSLNISLFFKWIKNDEIMPIITFLSYKCSCKSLANKQHLGCIMSSSRTQYPFANSFSGVFLCYHDGLFSFSHKTSQHVLLLHDFCLFLDWCTNLWHMIKTDR